MAYLVDTSILARLANSADLFHSVAATSVEKLHLAGESLHITPQVIVEFRNAATRPKELNGLGLTLDQFEQKTAVFEAVFPLLPETFRIFPAWKALVRAQGIVGKQVHDARLVAICHVHSISHVLTFNVGHFQRMSTYGPGIVVIDPAAL